MIRLRNDWRERGWEERVTEVSCCRYLPAFFNEAVENQKASAPEGVFWRSSKSHDNKIQCLTPGFLSLRFCFYARFNAAL